MQTYETNQPWIVYRYGLTHDKWWPVWSSTRVLGYAKIECECAVCGVREVLKLRMPRFGAVSQPEGGKHPKRVRFLEAHAHPERPHPMAWEKPLLNPAAHPQGLDLDLLAMRTEADARARAEEGESA